MDAVAGVEPATVRLAFPPEPRLLGTVRLVVGIVARKAGMGAEGIEDLKVAVSETCAVAVGDLTRAGRQDPIEIDLVEAVDRFGVEVRDRAPAPAQDPGDPADGEVDDLKTSALEDGGNRTSFWLRRAPELLDPLSTGGLPVRPLDPPDDLPPPLT